MKSLRSLAITLLCLLGLNLVPAWAQLTVDVTTSAGRQIPIAVVPFRGETPEISVTRVIGVDLADSGLFRLVPAGGLSVLPSEPSEINFSDWAGRSAEALVIGSIQPAPGGQLEVRYRLFDVVRQIQLAGASFVIQQSQLRVTAHKIADDVFEKLTGDKGVFSTRIAYVVKRSGQYELTVAEADTSNPVIVWRSPQSIISPKWSPDGNRLAYVTFDSNKATVVVQTLATGDRLVVANFFGNNSAPAWSPDGKSLAVTLTKDGTSQIYVIPATGGTPRRLTESAAIDTEADWSPDGSFITFISDRSGGPQIYRVPVTGGQPQRLSFEGSYNVSPRVSPDGRSIAFVQRDDGKFRIALLDIASGQITLLSDGPLDESPSFAPNGKMILFESTQGGRGSLARVSVDGRIKQRRSAVAGDVRDPAWGPFVK